MKKTFAGALVGGIILFIWQFLSWTILDLHRESYQYTPRQDSMLQYLGTQLPGSGQYMLPGFPKGTSFEQQKKQMEASKGKPWAVISYHQSMRDNMVPNMIRGLAVNIVLVWLFCWIIVQSPVTGFGKTWLAAVFTGLIVFLNGAYTLHIWYETPGISADLWDALISWGICGAWLGWWLSRKPSRW
jgi:hypothetical protein